MNKGRTESGVAAWEGYDGSGVGDVAIGQTELTPVELEANESDKGGSACGRDKGDTLWGAVMGGRTVGPDSWHQIDPTNRRMSF